MSMPLMPATAAPVSLAKSQVVAIQEAGSVNQDGDGQSRFQLETTDANPLFHSGGMLAPFNPAPDNEPLIGTVHSESPPSQQALRQLSDAHWDTPLHMSAAGVFYSAAPVSSLNAESRMQSTTVLPSVGETKSSVQLPASASEPLSQLSRNQIAMEILPTAAPILAQTSTTNTHNALHFGASSQVNGAEWASIKVDTGAAKWGEQMMQVLHDRVTLQAQQNVQEAKIRLDPPELGKMNLIVRVEGDTLNVQINANAAATREALVQVSDRLRTELQNQNFLNVNVNVGSDDNSQQQTPHQVSDEFMIFSARDTSQTDSLSTLSEHWLSTQA